MCGSFATHTPPLDSRLRGNDELRGRNDENAEWRGSSARSKATQAHFRTNGHKGTRARAGSLTVSLVLGLGPDLGRLLKLLPAEHRRRGRFR